MTTAFDFEAQSITGEAVSLSTYRGQVLLIVNTASACGFTPQFAGLQSLWTTYGSKGLTVLGFPSNEFGAQDPGTNGEIAQFCETRYSVNFPMMAKIEVNGSHAHPLYQFLKGEKPGVFGTESIKWNFTKFLVGRDGQVIKRYGSTDKPESIATDIETALGAAGAAGAASAV